MTSYNADDRWLDQVVPSVQAKIRQAGLGYLMAEDGINSPSDPEGHRPDTLTFCKMVGTPTYWVDGEDHWTADIEIWCTVSRPVGTTAKYKSPKWEVLATHRWYTQNQDGRVTDSETLEHSYGVFPVTAPAAIALANGEPDYIAWLLKHPKWIAATSGVSAA